MSEKHPADQPSHRPDELPFVAPCRDLDTGAPFRWIKLGWHDLLNAPKQSLAYGIVLLLLSYLISLTAFYFGNIYILLAMLSGFIFLGPVMAVGLYSISRQLQDGRSPELGYCLREERRHLGNELVFTVILLIVFLVWARAASMVHVFFPAEGGQNLADIALFLGIGSAVGSIFAAVIFCASAFSLPMIMDRKVDMVTAVISSVNAVLRNKMVMMIWALVIAFSVVIGFATAFIGLAILLPVIGHATWHAYQETIDASAWPNHTDE